MLSNSLSVALLVAFLVGLFVFALGTLIVRYADHISALFPRTTRQDEQTQTKPDLQALALLGLEDAPPQDVPAEMPQQVALAETPLRVVEIPDETVILAEHQEADIHEVVVSWTREVLGATLETDVEMRIDMLERLAIVNSPWARDVLALARQEETEPRVILVLASLLGNTA